MASILDIGILDYFMPVFVFLFIFGILFAILEKTNLFTRNKGINSLVAFTLSLIFVLTPDLMNLVSVMTPWFVILIVFTLFIILIFMFVGIKEEAVSAAFASRSVVWFLVVVCFIILIYAMTEVYGSRIHGITAGEEAGEGSAVNDVGRVIFHPRILGVGFLLVIAAQAVRLISQGFK
ncbi:hypothetical protein HY643_04830 [Candidatus Woesearchaeota archaeon]|nr:hypothetical protein [Candidatus Woesearchaeota archaeon]